MKVKRTAGNEQPANDAKAPRPGEIPEELKCLVGSQAQIIGNILSEPLKEPKVRAALAGLLSGLSLDFGVPVPAWVRQASTTLLESCGLLFLSQKAAQEITNADLGKLVGLWETIPNRSSEPTKEARALDFMCAELKRLSCNEPPAAARDFHDGRLKARQIDDKASNPSNRTRILILLLIGWPEVEKLKSSSELWQWLLFQSEADGRKGIAPGTDSREIRAVCKIIGLRYPNRGGRPRKKN